MDRKQAKQILATLNDELVAIERRAGSLRKLIEGYTELFPELVAEVVAVEAGGKEAADDRPRGTDAVLRVLKERPGKWFTVRLMTTELQRRGWQPESNDPESVIRTTLARAYAADRQHIKKGRGEKTSQVTYSYKEPGTVEDESHAAVAPSTNGHAHPPLVSEEATI